MKLEEAFTLIEKTMEMQERELRELKEEIRELKEKVYDLEINEKQNFESVHTLNHKIELFMESVQSFLTKINQVYNKKLELHEFEKKYFLNSDAKELKEFTREKIEKEIQEIIKGE